MFPRLAVVAGVALLLATCGCAVARKVTTRGELANLRVAGQPIKVYAHDDRVYDLERHALEDSVIRGTGTLARKGRKADFDGSIPLEEIIAISTESRSNIKGYALAGVTVLFVAHVAAGPAAGGGLNVVERIVRYVPPTYSGGGESCPYVYAWNGSGYELQAEPFGVAWGKALELTTLHMLPAARADDGIVRLRVTDERRETHYINSIRLHAIDLGRARAAVLDVDGRAWPLSSPTAPVEGRDESGADILPLVTSADDRMWECDPSSLTPDSGYEDVLEIAFERPDDASTGTLVLTGINTDLAMAFYAQLCQVVGDQAAVLAHAIENDPELIAELRGYLRDASLEVRMWNGRDWESAGAYQPEASAVTFTRGLRISIPEGAGKTVRMRLRSMADVWRIDAIAADWGDAAPLPMRPVEMRSAVGPSGEDLRNVIGMDDDRYAILLPPDRIDLTFAAAESPRGGNVAYAVAGRGYLHEWAPREAEAELAAVASMVPAEDRIEFVKKLLGHRDLFMQPAYEAWRKIRAQKP